MARVWRKSRHCRFHTLKPVARTVLITSVLSATVVIGANANVAMSAANARLRRVIKQTQVAQTWLTPSARKKNSVRIHSRKFRSKTCSIEIPSIETLFDQTLLTILLRDNTRGLLFMFAERHRDEANRTSWADDRNR